MARFYAKRAMAKQVELYNRDHSYRFVPFWMNHLFEIDVTHLEVSIGEKRPNWYFLSNPCPRIYKGAFM